ncbi:YhcN/YlaJ family sporulation lipoprotein [Paenibacillus sp. NFR01]|uniref:YhcN/YlaJ family sporulation lipoprotein n=1 Tax=Paenibacillus sp. NFR01 TaxID=1566279 RepID=UPI0008B4E0B6|nr:YhcN/YlaJ family sporulation lipoprotein [Paenibacillus sp. NFR01]SET64588.1 sporulation lipoprotein, YhcN/YlaJ family [Paenibacillus sp. NFR01]
MRKSMCLLLLLLLLTSCGVADKDASPSPQDKQSEQAAKELSVKGNRQIRQMSAQDQVANNNELRSGETAVTGNEKDVALKDHFEQLAKRVPGVKGAHCVVVNNVAVVGIDVAGSLDRSRVGTIKYSVAEAIRKDPKGVRAFVTADLDIGNRLTEMGKHISQGHPVSGFSAELADMIGRIIPQLPEDTKPGGNR